MGPRENSRGFFAFMKDIVGEMLSYILFEFLWKLIFKVIFKVIFAIVRFFFGWMFS
jgi:hypothetical protein